MDLKFNPQKHRRSIRLPGFDYTRAGAYFITIVTQNRLRLFGQVVAGEMQASPLGQIALQQWERLPRRFPQVGLGEFMLMPNHLHGIIVIYADGLYAADLSDSHWPTPVDIGAPFGTGTAVGTGTAERSNDYGLEPSRRAPTTAAPPMPPQMIHRANDLANPSPVPSPPLFVRINRP